MHGKASRGLRGGRVLSVVAAGMLALGSVGLVAVPAQAAALTVNSLGDGAESGDNACTLREAITNANADVDTSEGDCFAGSGADIITFSVTGTISLGSQLPVIADVDGLTIVGPDAQGVTISGGDQHRILGVAVGASLNLSNLVLAHGFADGGSALTNSGSLAIADSTFEENVATFDGGAVLSDGTVTITNALFRDNAAGGDGGAVFLGGAGGVVTDSTFTSNAAPSGGALSNFADLAIYGSTFEANTGINVVRNARNLTIINATLTGNIVTGEVVSSLGGATIANSTLAGNAGVDLDFDSKGQFLISNSVVDSCGSESPEDGGYNVESGTSCGFSAPGSRQNTNAGLATSLADNGGPTQTLLPQAGSPLIDAIPVEVCGADADQRGVARPQGGMCDIGAVEIEVDAEEYTISLFAQPVDNQPIVNRAKAGRTLPLKFSVTDQEGMPVLGLTGNDVSVDVDLGQCGSSSPTDVMESYSSGSGLVDNGDGTYQYDFKTLRSWAGKCGALTLVTPFGGERSATFEFR